MTGLLETTTNLNHEGPLGCGEPVHVRDILLRRAMDFHGVERAPNESNVVRAIKPPFEQIAHVQFERQGDWRIELDPFPDVVYDSGAS